MSPVFCFFFFFSLSMSRDFAFLFHPFIFFYIFSLYTRTTLYLFIFSLSVFLCIFFYHFCSSLFYFSRLPLYFFTLHFLLSFFNTFFSLSFLLFNFLTFVLVLEYISRPQISIYSTFLTFLSLFFFPSCIFSSFTCYYFSLVLPSLTHSSPFSSSSPLVPTLSRPRSLLLLDRPQSLQVSGDRWRTSWVSCWPCCPSPLWRTAGRPGRGRR